MEVLYNRHVDDNLSIAFGHIIGNIHLDALADTQSKAVCSQTYLLLLCLA